MTFTMMVPFTWLKLSQPTPSYDRWDWVEIKLVRAVDLYSRSSTPIVTSIHAPCTADEGGREIADMLKHNQSIKKLLLSSNLLGKDSFSVW